MVKNQLNKIWQLRKRIFEIISSILLGVFFVTIFQTATLQTALSENFSEKSTFRVKSHPNFNLKFSGKAKVIDGDSIKVGKKEVRLVGIDAPEYSQNCFDEKNQEYGCGKESRKFLFEMIQDKEVQCLYAELDKYDRYLGKCFLGEESVNEKILENGWAVIYNFEETDEKMVSLEKSAKLTKKGIWRGAFELPKDYRRKNPRN